ncbi:DUF6603 domain-containing protein, partial [Streptomyces sp. NPDC090442]|uniref:DUF6603 domain-containing protein n=1 Tax=Streptomyces sp. NPDC090442 TaxID=3365962 RepID=UPI0037FB73D5
MIYTDIYARVIDAASNIKEQPGYPPECIIDGDGRTSYRSERPASSDDWIMFELDSLQFIESVYMLGSDIPSGTLQYSTNKENWLDLPTTFDPSVGLYYRGVKFQARYVQALFPDPGASRPMTVRAFTAGLPYEPFEGPQPSARSNIDASPGYELENILDGKSDSSFTSNLHVSAGDWIAVDLKCADYVRSAVMSFGALRPPKAVLEFSEDGRIWNELSVYSGGAGAPVQLSYAAEPGSEILARFLRMRMLDDSSGRIQVCLFEADLVSSPAHARSDLGVTEPHGLGGMLDGKSDTYYLSGPAGSETPAFPSISLDLGTAQDISRIHLLLGDTQGGFRPPNSVLESSPDGFSWVRVGWVDPSVPDSWVTPEKRLVTRHLRMRITGMLREGDKIAIRSFETESNSARTFSRYVEYDPIMPGRSWTLKEYEPDRMVDGDPGTYFLSYFAVRSGDYIEVDFGAEISVPQIFLALGDGDGGYEAPACKLRYSGDAESGWKDLTDIPAGQSDFLYEPTMEAGLRARKLSLLFTASSGRVAVRAFTISMAGLADSVELAQDVTVGDEVLSPGSGAGLLAAFRRPDDVLGTGVESLEALMRTAGQSAADVQYIRRREASPTGWVTLLPFADSGQNLSVESIAALTAGSGVPGSLGHRAIAFLQTTGPESGLYYSEKTLTSNWSRLVNVSGPTARAPRPVHTSDGQPVVYALEQEPDVEHGYRLLLFCVNSRAGTPVPKMVSLGDVAGLPENPQDSDFYLVPVAPSTAGSMALAVVKDGVLHITMFDPDSSTLTGAAHHIDGATAMAGGFYSDSDPGGFQILFKAGSEVRAIRVAYEERISFGEVSSLIGAPISVGSDTDRAYIREVMHQPDETGGRVIYYTGSLGDPLKPGSRDAAWVQRWIKPPVPDVPDWPVPEWGEAIPIGAETVLAPLADEPEVYLGWRAHRTDTPRSGLWAHVRDRRSGRWSHSHVLVGDAAVVSGHARTEAMETTRYRAILTVPGRVPDAPVTLAVPRGAPGFEILLGGRSHWISRDPTPARTDMYGRLAFTAPATGLGGPEIQVTVPGFVPRTVRLSGDIVAYLSGIKDDLNPTNPPVVDSSGQELRPGGALPPFDEDGRTLATARRSDGSLVVPAATARATVAQAAQALQAMAQASIGTFSGAGFDVDLEAAGGVRFRALETQEELSAARTASFGDGEAEGFWDWVVSALGDAWEGVTAGALRVQKFLVDVANRTADLFIYVGGKIVKAASATWQSLQELAGLAVQVFEAIKSRVEDAIDWLKALFDFDAIRNTQKGLIEAIDFALARAQGSLDFYEEGLSGWAEGQKSAVQRAFQRIRDEAGLQELVDVAPSIEEESGSYQQQTEDPHANWLHDKVDVKDIDATAPSPAPDLISNLGRSVESEEDFLTSGSTGSTEKFKEITSSPSGLFSTAVKHLLDLVEEIALHAIDMTIEAISAAISLARDLLSLIRIAMTTEFKLPTIVDAAWNWVTGGGVPCTLASVTALILAFPVTIAYKLAHGVAHEPFPGGKLPDMTPSTQAEHDETRVLAPNPFNFFGEMAGIVRACGSLFAAALDGVEYGAELPGGTPGSRIVIGLAAIEYSILSIDLAFCGAAEGFARDAYTWTYWGIAAFGLGMAWVLKFYKRVQTAAEGKLILSLAVEIFAFLYITMLAFDWAMRGKPDLFALSLTLSGILLCVPDVFGAVASVQRDPAIKGKFVLLKMIVDLAALIPSGVLAYVGYTNREIEDAKLRINDLDFTVGEQIRLDYSIRQWDSARDTLNIWRDGGSTVYEQILPSAYGSQQVQTDSTWVPGTYHATIVRGDTRLTEPVRFTVKEAPVDSLVGLLGRAGASGAVPPRVIVPGLSGVVEHGVPAGGFAATARAEAPGAGGVDARVVVLRTAVSGGAAGPGGSVVVGVVEAGVGLDGVVLPLLGLPAGAVRVPHVHFVFCSRAVSVEEAGEVNAVIGRDLPVGTPLLPVGEEGYGAGWCAAVTHAASGTDEGVEIVPWPGRPSVRAGGERGPAMSVPGGGAGSSQAGVPVPVRAGTVSGRGVVGVRLGPVEIAGVRAVCGDELLVRLDCGIRVGGLRFEPDQLGFAVSLEGDGFVCRVTLAGASVQGAGVGVTLAGALVPEPGDTALGGEVVAEIMLTPQGPSVMLAMSALWEYRSPQPSLLLYAEEHRAHGAVAGGVWPLAVLALSAGVGVHTGVRLPARGEEDSFPLVQRLDAGGGRLTARQALELLQRGGWLTVQQGRWWMAGGIEYSIYEFMHAKGLLSADDSSSQDTDTVVLGRETLRFPPTGGLVMAAHVNVDYTMRRKPVEGLLFYDTTAGPGSYFMDRRLHLDGPVAMRLWTAGTRRGDFALSAGGYHPAIAPRYPAMGSLTLFSWSPGGNITATGSIYGAVVPNISMFGGRLDLDYAAGGAIHLQAWMHVSLHTLMQWKPFQFLTSIGVRVGAAATVKVWFIRVRVSVEVGVDLDIWGPP